MEQSDRIASRSFFSEEETFNVQKSFPSQAYQHSLNNPDFFDTNSFLPQSKRLKLSSQTYTHESDGSDDMVEVVTESETEAEMETETEAEMETDQKLINHTQVPTIIGIRVRLLF
jgi:hypothetical protein